MSTLKTVLPVSLLPLGSWEPHGDHLPYDTDTRIAVAIAQGVHEALNKPSGRPMVMNAEVRLLPALPYSCSQEWQRSLSLKAATLLTVLDEIANDAPGGLFVVINAHGGNRVLEHWALQNNRARPRCLYAPREELWRTACEKAGIEAPWGEDVHGGEIERSLMLHLHPELVGEAPARGNPVRPEVRRFHAVVGMAESAPHGFIGHPALATADKGKRLLQALVSECVLDIANMSMRLWKSGDRRKAAHQYPPEA